MSEQPSGSGDVGRREPSRGADLGFFAGAPGPSQPSGQAPSQFGGPPPSQFGGASAYESPSRFGSPAASQFGAAPQPQFGGPAPTQFGTTPFGHAPPTAPASSGSRLPRWAVVTLVSAGALFAVAVIAAIAVPVYLNMHAKSIADSTTIATPAQIGDFSQATDQRALGAAQQFQQQMMADEGPARMKEVLAAIYQQGSIRALVVAGRPTKAMTEADQGKFIQGFVDGYERSSGVPPVMSPVVKGSLSGLGGLFSCAQVEVGNTVDVLCLATSPGAFEVILVEGAAYSEATDIAITLREGVEHRS